MAGWKAASVVVGGVLIHLTLGTIFSFGNMNPYLTSYMRKTGSAPDLTYTKCSWIVALYQTGFGLSVFLGGVIHRKLGPRLTTLLGGSLMSLGTALTYLTCQHSFVLTVLTYGLLAGLGTGVSYAVPINCAIKWLPHKKGMVSGIIVGGFGFGSFIFTPVQTLLINPDNLKPTYEEDDEVYFQQDSLLHKVPSAFLILGACYSVLQLVGSLLLREPSEKIVEELAADEKTFLVITTGKPSGHVQKEFECTPSEVLRSKHFYMLFFMYLFDEVGSLFVVALYKAYGQTFIDDDNFLSLVGSIAAVFNCLGRLFWGKLADILSFKIATLFMNCSFTVLILTFPLTKFFGVHVLFMVYVCLICGTLCGAYSLFPTAAAKCFGLEYMAINYGMLATCKVIVGPLGVFAFQMLKASIGWTGLMILTAGCSFCSFCIAIGFHAKDRHGKEI